MEIEFGALGHTFSFIVDREKKSTHTHTNTFQWITELAYRLNQFFGVCARKTRWREQQRCLQSFVWRFEWKIGTKTDLCISGAVLCLEPCRRHAHWIHNTQTYTMYAKKIAVFFFSFHSLWLRSTDAIRILRCKCCCKAWLFISHNKLLDITWTNVHQRGSCYRYEIRCQRQRLVFFRCFFACNLLHKNTLCFTKYEFSVFGQLLFFLFELQISLEFHDVVISVGCVFRWSNGFEARFSAFKSFDTNWIWRY